jgi:hypothetical protein
VSSYCRCVGHKVSLDVRAGDVPLTAINVTLVESSRCEQLSAQVRETAAVQMDERLVWLTS